MAQDCDQVVSSGLYSEDEMIAFSSTTNNQFGHIEQPSTSVEDPDDLMPCSRRRLKCRDDKSCLVCGDKALGYNFNAITCESCKAFFRRNASKDKRYNLTVTKDPDDLMPCSRRRLKCRDDKSCLVCGDKALGYNFNAITCESCKAFFRRNASKDKSMACLFDNNCLVNVRTRRFCPACRIKKCYKIGMKRDMILDDGERKKRLTKVMTNRAKKEHTVTTESAGIQIKLEVKSEIDINNSVIDSPVNHGTIMETERPPTPYGKTHDRPSDVIFRHIPQHLLPSDSRMYYKLTCDESTLLANVTKAYQETLAAMPEMGPYSESKQYQKAADLINHSEVCVRKLIMFVKHLDDFRRLSQEDQIAALKACVMNTLLLRSALFYSIEKDAWLTPKGEIPTSILKNTTGFVSLHNDHVYYCRRVKSMAQNDHHIYALLQVLIIFDPAGMHLSDREFISSLQDRYIVLLKHYFESNFSFEFAKEYYVSAMDRLCDLKVLSEEHAKVLLQVNPVDVEPLMLEVLNLK